MLWTIVIGEALIIAVIITRMVIKRKALTRETDDEPLPAHSQQPEVDLPEEERWN